MALYLHTDSANFFKRGMKLGYSQLPSTVLEYTDLAEFPFTYAGGNWIYIYAGLNY